MSQFFGWAMDSYNFWQDFFDTYQSLSDWMKALWLIVPPAFLLGFVKLFVGGIRERRTVAPSTIPGTLIYSIYRDDQNRTLVFNHATELTPSTNLVLLDPPHGETKEGEREPLMLSAGTR